MKKRKSFFYQMRILTDRYMHIFINDKQNLLLDMIIPLLTVFIVCMVAAPDMYSIVPQNDHRINSGYPVLMWEDDRQEVEKDNGEIEVKKPDEVETKSWKDKKEAPATLSKIDGENYWMITDVSQLNFLSSAIKDKNTKYLTYNYILQVDIDYKDHKFTPIGDSKYPFTGTFDGNGHLIRNFKVDTSADNAGLFGVVQSNETANSKVTFKTQEQDPKNPQKKPKVKKEKLTFRHNGIVKNLKLMNSTVSTDGCNAGIVAGKIQKSSRITSVCVKGGSVYAKKGGVGALVGRVSDDTPEIYLCYSVGTKVDSGDKYVGGLVGDLGSGKLSGAYSTAEIKCLNSGRGYCGIVVGNCANSDNVINVYYLSQGDKEDQFATMVEEEELIDSSSLMTAPHKIRSAYDIDNNLGNEDADDPVYGFKKDDQLSEFSGTQTGLFMLVCVAIFVGICNSIQEICKERNILKREYMTNLRLSSYVVSKLVVQAILCAIQMAVVVLIFYLFVMGKKLPDNGALLSNIWLEYFITMFLLCFAADTMALFISAIVKNSATANTFIPIILIVQIVFSGVLFEISGIMENVSYVMISKWGISALAATSHINDAQQSFLIDNPTYQLNLGNSMSMVKDLYASTSNNILFIWGIILLFAVVFSVACTAILTRVKHDKR
jgi:hypothetical protein